MKNSNTIASPSKRRKRLAALLKANPDTIRVNDAMQALDVNREKATWLLAGWHNQGLLRRVAHGVYVPIKPSAVDQTQVLEDPWILVPELYDPGYIGGWSALEHWGLTEQLFRSICVLTGKRTGFGEKELQGVKFFIKHVSDKRLFGTKTIWREHIKIQISDPHKTILDILEKPILGAGLQHTFDCFKEYANQYKSQSDRQMLLDYAARINNGALFKKLGFFAEQAGFEKRFLKACRENLTQGYTSLDKNLTTKKLVTRWRLWIPESWDIND